MYCPTCSAFITEGVAYCPRCGGRITPGALAPVQPPAKLGEVIQYLTVTTGAVALGGFIFAFVLAVVLSKRGMDTSAIVILVFASLLTVCIISGMLIRLLARSMNAYMHTDGRVEAQQKPEPGRRISNTNTAQIEEPRQPVSSVTDHTTRTFDPIYKDTRG
jgi:hypothetical protein